VIHHLSIPARNPKHVAAVLTELFRGTLTGFGPYGNSFIAWMGDEHGSAIEIYPTGTEMLPDQGMGQANFRHVDVELMTPEMARDYVAAARRFRPRSA
jgi:hypothetical protein